MRVFVNFESITSLKCCYQLSKRFHKSTSKNMIDQKHDILLIIKKATIFRNQNAIDTN